MFSVCKSSAIFANMQICCNFARLFKQISTMNILITIDRWLDSLPFRRNRRIKQELRAVLSQKRRVLRPEQVKAASATVIEKIIASSEFQKAQTVMLYYPIHNEIDLRTLLRIAPEKHYLLPVTHRKSIEVRTFAKGNILKKGKFGIPEPQTEKYKGDIDLILVPGVAFDKHGHRMGRGGGYYDRFLKCFRRATKIGVAYDFQMTKEVPTSWHDVRMDKVIHA